MSVENRIFWLLIGILALWIVFSTTGRGAVNRFLFYVFGFGDSPGGAPSAGNQKRDSHGDPVYADGPPPGQSHDGPAVA